MKPVPGNPFRNEPSRSASGSAGARLVILLLVSAGSGFCPPLMLVVPAFLCIRILVKLGDRSSDILSESRFLVPLGILALMPAGMDALGGNVERAMAALPDSAVYLARLLVMTLAARVFYRTTTSMDAGDAISAVFRTLPGMKGSDPGFFIGLSASFLPRCFDRYRGVAEAAAARGFGAARSGHKHKAMPVRQRVRSFLMLAETGIVSLLSSATRTAEAMEARGYTPDRLLSPSRFRLKDVAGIGAGLLFACVSFLWRKAG